MPKKVGSVCNEMVFRQLFERHAGDLYDFLYYKFGAAIDHHDVVQEAFLKLWKNCRDIPEEKARSFLFTVARNQILNDISRQKTVLNYRKEPHPAGTSETPESVLRETEYMQKLQEALESLSEDQRVTFMLNRVEGKKHQEIAEMLGISRKAVEKRIYTALAILRSKLENFE